MNIYRANIVYTPSPDAFCWVPRGYVGVDDDGIIVGVYAELPDGWRSLPVTDFGDRLLFPAFCDLHVHAPQYRNMGLALDEELLPWLEKYVFPEEAKFADAAYAERIYRRFVHELWMQGTMRSAVFASAHAEATRCLMRLFEEAGIGAYIGMVGMDRNCPANLRNTPDDVRRFYGSFGRQPDTALVRTILTPRFVPSCSPEMMRTFGDLAVSYGLPVQSHLSENRSEIRWVKELEPESVCYGDAYYRYGLFGQTPTLMAHCCYTEGEELALMARQHVMAVHCPTSNCNVASGIAPVRTLLEAGVPIALGTDVSAGHHLSVLRVMQYAVQMSKLVYAQSEGKMPFLTLSEVFYMATKGGGRFFGKVGSFEPGYEFDALVVDDSYLNFDCYTLPQRLERYVYQGDDRDIRHRFCRGKEVPEPSL